MHQLLKLLQHGHIYRVSVLQLFLHNDQVQLPRLRSLGDCARAVPRRLSSARLLASLRLFRLRAVLVGVPRVVG